jgi:hypothetical protein
VRGPRRLGDERKYFDSGGIVRVGPPVVDGVFSERHTATMNHGAIAPSVAGEENGMPVSTSVDREVYPAHMIARREPAVGLCARHLSS